MDRGTKIEIKSEIMCLHYTVKMARIWTHIFLITEFMVTSLDNYGWHCRWRLPFWTHWEASTRACSRSTRHNKVRAREPALESGMWKFSGGGVVRFKQRINNRSFLLTDSHACVLGCSHVCLKSQHSTFKRIHKQKKAAVLSSKQYFCGKAPREWLESTKQPACE